jgi:hypothetical protein
VIELVYRRGGTVSLPNGREASSEFAAARMLIADGHDPATPVRTRWPGSRHHSLSGTLGGWAELRVDEDGMRFRKNMPLPAGHEPAARRFVGEELGGGV